MAAPPFKYEPCKRTIVAVRKRTELVESLAEVKR